LIPGAGQPKATIWDKLAAEPPVAADIGTTMHLAACTLLGLSMLTRRFFASMC